VKFSRVEAVLRIEQPEHRAKAPGTNNGDEQEPDRGSPNRMMPDSEIAPLPLHKRPFWYWWKERARIEAKRLVSWLMCFLVALYGKL